MDSSTTMEKKQKIRKKTHPKKFGMWIAIGSILMMFAGFTSAYIVRRSQGNWLKFDLPIHFYISTVLVLLSSLTIWWAAKAYKKKSMYPTSLAITAVLGILFAVFQYLGFSKIFEQITWNNNVSLQYLLVIIAVHAIHILGGVIALIVMSLKTIGMNMDYDPKKENVNLTIMSTYWHFVGILWIYLFIFFILNP